MNPPIETNTDIAGQDEQVYCYGHPKTPTKLRCSRCDRPICGRCAIPASVGQHCPECVAEARKSAPKVRSALAATAPVVMAILVVNVAVFFLQNLMPGLTDELAMNPFAVASGEWFRLLTPMILHGGLLHLAFNSFALFSFGPVIEQHFGHVRFALMYLASGLLASALSYAVPPNNSSIGASGAIFGVAGVLLVYLYNRRKQTFIRDTLRSLLGIIGLNLVFGFIASGLIDNWAHIGGLIGGIILGFGFDDATAEGGHRHGGAQVASVIAVVGLAAGLVLWRTPAIESAFGILP